MKTTLALIATMGLASTAFAGVIEEVEPNDTFGTAQALGVLSNGSLVHANHVPAGGGVTNEDWFTFTLPDLGGLWTIETLQDFDGPGDGTADTRLFLYLADGVTLVDSDDDGGTLDPDTSFGLSLITGIAPGTYSMVNDGFTDDDGTDGVDYFISFTSTPAPGALALLGLAGLAGTRRRR